MYIQRALPRTTRAYYCYVCPRFDFKREVTEHADSWSGGVAEVNVLKSDMTSNILGTNTFPILGFSVDVRG